MKSTYQDRLGLSDNESEQAKRAKFSHAAVGGGSGYAGSASYEVSSPLNRPTSSGLVSGSAAEAELLAALQGRGNTSSVSNYQSLLNTGGASTGGIGASSQDVLRSFLLAQQSRTFPSSIPSRTGNIQDLLMSQIAGSSAFPGNVNNMDLLSRAAAVSGSGSLATLGNGVVTAGVPSNQILNELLASQQSQQLNNAQFEPRVATAVPNLSGLSSSLQLREYLLRQQLGNEPSHGLATDLLLQQQQQQQQLLLGSSFGAALPDAALRQMARGPVPASHGSSTHLLPSALEDRIRALRTGLHTSSGNAKNMDTGSIPTVSFEGDKLTPMALASEQWVMSEYQCLLRKQIVFVEANANENGGKTQGRNKPIVHGQVGILCRHCARLPPRNRLRGAVYFPAMLHRIYQAAQNMAHNHFAGSCQAIPEETKQRLLLLKEQKVITVGAGKEYWVSAAVTVGVQEREDGLFFAKKDPEATEEQKKEGIASTSEDDAEAAVGASSNGKTP